MLAVTRGPVYNNTVLCTGIILWFITVDDLSATAAKDKEINVAN